MTNTRGTFWTTTTRTTQILLTVLLVIVANLDVTFACKSISHNPKTTTSDYKTKWPEVLTTRTFNILDYTLIDSNTTCNHTDEPNKTLIFCYNNGKCHTKYIYINRTHYEKLGYCICAKCYDGELCRENICIFNFIEAKFGIFIGCILALAFIGGFFYLIIRCRKGSLSEEAGRKVEKLNEDRRNRTPEDNALLQS